MERREFVERALSAVESKSSLCREFGISRPTGDKWIRRMLEGQSLSDQDKTPIHQPRRTSLGTEAKIILLRQQYPFIGARKLHRMLENQGETGIPSPSTINAILHRNGLITPAASQVAKPYQRFAMAEPNACGRRITRAIFP